MKKFIAIVAAIVIAVSASYAGTGITGFLPQKTGFKQNFTPDEIADYAFQGAKPDITPSNKFWDNNYADYAAELKNQIVTWMRAEAGDPNLSEADAEEKFRHMPVRKTKGKVKATGLSINQTTGEILGLAQPIERDPYETVDGLGEYEIYGKKGAMSCVCGNTHLGIETAQADNDEWEKEDNKKSSTTYSVPTGITSLTINNYNNSSATANPTVTASPTATATNTPAKVGYVDDNSDPEPIVVKKPRVVYEDDQTTTTTTTRKRGCNDCGNDSKYIVVQEKTTPGQKLFRFGQWLNGAGQAAGSLMYGAAAQQGKLGTKITNVINNFIPGNVDNNDDGGDGGNLPDIPNDPNDPNGDGGNLPGIRRVSGLR